MAFKKPMTAEERGAMHQSLQDRVFEGLDLRVAEVDFTFSNQASFTSLCVEAISTRGGKIRRFTVEIRGDRIDQYGAGLGAHIQALWSARCDAAFARRD